MTAPEHETIVQAMLQPGFYPHRVSKVDLIQTHISSVLLAGDRVYKLKKPVNFGFVDFSTPARRERFCREEFRINRRLAPDVYLGVEPVTRTTKGFELSGSGPVSDWVVVMRRMPEELMGPRLLERGGLTEEHIEALVEVLTPFYRRAASGVEMDLYGRPAELRLKTEENFNRSAGFTPLCLSAGRLSDIRHFSDAFLDDRAELFARRMDEGRIRECHGDLHLGNICFEDPPRVFDAIEFNESFRCMDMAGDLAFLAMDLDFNGLPGLARRLVEGYVAASGDEGLAEVLPFYRCYYAMVRGKIHSLAFDDPGMAVDDRRTGLGLARRYFRLAHGYAGGRERPKLIVPLGLMASGKSALSRWLFGRHGWPIIRSDMVRKKLTGVAESSRVHDPFGRGMYSPEMTRRTYRAMFDIAAGFLEAGQGVILDASFKRNRDRQLAVDLAGKWDADIIFILTRCTRQEQSARLAKRRIATGPSDGRLELMDRQAADFDPPGETEAGRLIIVDTDGTKEETRDRVDRELKKHGFID